MLKQKVISNPEIFPSILQELAQAKKSINVVTAWFTDTDLFNMLIEKAKANVTINVVIADNAENERLNINELTSVGASVIKIKRDGYGMMHQKFCIIDNKIAIHGSYNWTHNARKNNNESVILTDHRQTIKQLNTTYMKIVEATSDASSEKVSPFKIIGKNFKSIRKPAILSDAFAVNTNDKNLTEEPNTSDFTGLLEELIEAEIYKFDKEELTQRGFDKAQLTNGDAQSLANILDTLYADFINSLEIAGEKKQTLLLKINELKNKRLNSLVLEKENEISNVEKDFTIKSSDINKQIDTIASEIEKYKLDQQKIEEKQISTIDGINKGHQNEIEHLELDSIHSKIKWYELIPSLVLFTGLLVYVFVFYSSAAYILIFGNRDAELAKKMGQNIVPPEIFEPNAYSKAIEHGGASILFILLFVFVPITISLLNKFIKTKAWYKELGIYSLILLVDGIIAYQVTMSIHEVNYLSGIVDVHFTLDLLFKSSDFYLVFVMGALGLLGIKFMYDKIHSIFESKDADAMGAKLRLQRKQLEQKVRKNETKKKTFLAAITELDKLIVDKQTAKKNFENDLNAHQLQNNRELKLINQNFSTQQSEVEDTATLYIQKIESNNLKFSVHAMHDRINTFLSGWVNFIHGMFAIPIAKQMTASANEQKEAWGSTILKKNSVA
jgi:hypothetical protein